MVKIDSTSSGLKVAPSAIGCGKLVPSTAACPCRHSSWNITGIPRRLFSRKNFWMALVSTAISRAFFPLPASLGRPTWPKPAAVSECCLRLLRVEVALGIHQRLRLSAARCTASAQLSPAASSAIADPSLFARPEVWHFCTRERLHSLAFDLRSSLSFVQFLLGFVVPVGLVSGRKSSTHNERNLQVRSPR